MVGQHLECQLGTLQEGGDKMKDGLKTFLIIVAIMVMVWIFGQAFSCSSEGSVPTGIQHNPYY